MCIYLSGWKFTKNNVDFTSMFTGCINITTLKLFDISQHNQHGI